MAAVAKVLLVDDEPHMRTYVGMLVRSTMPQVELLEAGDEAAALALFQQHRPGLVLLDINLVGSSGLDLLPRLLGIDAQAIIIMLTAVNIRRSVEEAMERGASGYILKDASFEVMTESLQEIVREKFGDANQAAPQ
jgi:DNA-binding NarL/FixJ family response regulator